MTTQKLRYPGVIHNKILQATSLSEFKPVKLASIFPEIIRKPMLFWRTQRGVEVHSFKGTLKQI